MFVNMCVLYRWFTKMSTKINTLKESNMAIMYVLTISDPTNVGPFPASVVNSDWYTNITNLAFFTAIGGNPGYTFTFIFEDQPTLDAWLADNTITDPGLLYDIGQWKYNCQVSYSNKFYTLPEINGITGIIS